MKSKMPRLVIAAVSGSSGKTVISMSVLSALRRKGLSVSAFKKGPDYIDSAWLSVAAGSTCRNLDTYMSGPEDILTTFSANAEKSDISIIEGNRGIFDGKDVSGTHSTARLAKLLQAPVVLIVNVSKMTRTIAAIVNGCSAFDPEVKIAGLILNRVAGERHRKIITDSIERYCNIPVFGTVPDLTHDSALIPGRHLGLVTPSEFTSGVELDDRLRKIADEYLDIEGLINVAGRASILDVPREDLPVENRPDVKIGYFNDSVFTFYYPENLEALRAAGGEVVPVSSIDDESLPELDALYIGGGFPETHVEPLVQNRSMMLSVKEAAERGMPIYAECGGLIYLSNSLICGESRYPMAGLFPVDLKMHTRPAGHGYTLSRIDRANPFFEIGREIRGHEFHYSMPVDGVNKAETCMKVESGVGLGNQRDGLVYRNTLACYMHIHAGGARDWASSIVSLARHYRSGQDGSAVRGSGDFGSGNQKTTGSRAAAR